MQKEIKNRELDKIVTALKQVDYKEKNIFSLRSEKLGQKLNLLAVNLNEKTKDAQMEHASTDKDGNFLFEQVTVTDKNGMSRMENTGNYKYTHAQLKARDKVVEQIKEENSNIPIYLIKKEGNEVLFKKIFEKYSPSTISTLAGIILDVPLDDEGFIDEAFYLEMTAEKVPALNGKQEPAAASVS